MSDEISKSKNCNQKLKYGTVLFFIFAFASFAPHARAAGPITITEIMYDSPGTDSDWIEVYNSGTVSVDLSKYFFHDDGPSNTAHSIKQVGTGTTSVAAGGYAIIANDGDSFAAANPGLVVLDSSFDISDTAASTLVIAEDSGKPPVTTDDSVICDPGLGATNDGNSLQLQADGTWAPALPTPGAANASAQASDTGGNGGGDSSGSTTNTTSTTTSTITPKQYVPPEMQAVLKVASSALVDMPVKMSVQVLGYSGETLSNGDFHFAFGDGTDSDATMPTPVSHIYKYPGSYVVMFDYRSNAYMSDPEVSARHTVVVGLSKVAIASVDSDGSIVLTNNDTSDANLSNWIVRSLSNISASVFTIPRGTILLPGASVTFSPEVTGIARADTRALGLMLPSGVASAVYNPTTDDSQADTATTADVTVSDLSQPVAHSNQSMGSSVDQSISSLPRADAETAESANVISPFVSNTDTSSDTTAGSHPLLWYLVGLGSVVVVGAVFLVRNKSFSSVTIVSETASTEETKAIADSIKIVE